MLTLLFEMEILRELLDELEREKKMKEYERYMSVPFYSHVYNICGIILLVLNSLTIIMSDKTVASMPYECVLEVFLLVRLHKYFDFISFWLNANKKKISEFFSTLSSLLIKVGVFLFKLISRLIKIVSWVIKSVGELRKCPAELSDVNKNDPVDASEDDPEAQKL